MSQESDKLKEYNKELVLEAHSVREQISNELPGVIEELIEIVNYAEAGSSGYQWLILCLCMTLLPVFPLSFVIPTGVVSALAMISSKARLDKFDDGTIDRWDIISLLGPKGMSLFRGLGGMASLKKKQSLVVLSLLILTTIGRADPFICGMNAPGYRECTSNDHGVVVDVDFYEIDGVKTPFIEQIYLDDVKSSDGALEGFLCENSVSGEYDKVCQNDCLKDKYLKEKSTSSLCSGSSEYCDKYNCQDFANCKCTYERYDRLLFCKTKDSVKKRCTGPSKFKLMHSLIKYYKYENGTETQKRKVGIMRKAKLNGRNWKKDDVHTGHATIDEHKLIIETNADDKYFVKIRKGDVTKLYECTGECKLELPERVFMSSGEMDVILTFSDQSEIELKVNVVGEKLCVIRDCVVCWSAYSNFKCQPAGVKMLLIGLVIYWSLGFMVLIPTLFWVTSTIWKCARIPFRCCTCCYGYTRDKLKKSEHLKTLKRTVWEDPEEVDVEEGRAKPRSVAGSGRSKFVNQTWVYVCCLLLIAQPALSCDSNVVLSSEALECINNGAIRECEIKTTFQTTLPFPGSKTCVFVKDGEENVARIEIEYDRAIDKAIGNTIYYTSGFEGKSETKILCFGQGNCDWGDACESEYIDSYDKNVKVGFSEEMLDWPGASTCDRLQGGWAYGCFSAIDKCAYSVYSLIPAESVYKVQEVGQRQKEVHISFEVNSLTDGSILSQGSFENAGSWSSFDGGKMRLEGIYNGEFSNLDQYKIVYGDENVWFSSGSDRNDPSVQTIGDMQAESSSHLQNGGVSSFIFDRTIVEKKVLSSSVTYAFRENGIKNLEIAKKLPVSIGGNLWKSDGNIAWSEVTNPGGATVSVELDGSLRVSMERNVVCPKAELVSADGCYSCDTGSKIVLNVWSECQEGSVTVSSEDFEVLTPSLVLGNSKREVDVQIAPTQASVQGELILSSGAEKARVQIEFTANEDVELRNDTLADGENWTEQIGSAFSTIGAASLGDLGFWPSFGFWTIAIALFFGALALLGLYLYKKVSPFTRAMDGVMDKFKKGEVKIE